MSIRVILGRDGMGDNATETDFENYANFICTNIDSKVGKFVDVYIAGKEDVQENQIRCSDSELKQTVENILQDLWNEWCAQ